VLSALAPAIGLIGRPRRAKRLARVVSSGARTRKQYVLSATTSKDENLVPLGGRWGYVSSDAYSDGAFVYSNNTTFGQLVGAPWTRGTLAATSRSAPR